MGLCPRAGKNKKAQGKTPTGVVSATKGAKRNRASTGESHVDPQSSCTGSPSINKSRRRKDGGCCKARPVVAIGRLTHDGNNRWLVSVREGIHAGHPVVTCSLLAKPTRLLDSTEMEIAAGALSSHSAQWVRRGACFFFFAARGPSFPGGGLEARGGAHTV